MNTKSPKIRTTKKSRGWFRRNIPKVIIIIAAIAILTWIAKLPEPQKDTSATEPAPVNVTVMTIVAEPQFTETFELPAVVEPNREVTVSAEVAGRIENIPVTKGSKVKAGDLLVQLNSDLLRPQFEVAEAQLKRDQIEFDRMSNLVENDATPRSDLDNATTQLAISKAQLENIREQLERTNILAPTAGTLNDLPVEMGEYVQPGLPVAQIVETDIVKVVVDVPERDISFMDIGREAEIFLDYKEQEKTLTGTIAFISELADSLTRSTRVEISANNEHGYLRSGQIVRVQLKRRVIEDAILIPLLAVIPMEEGNSVYVVNSTEAQRRRVELGLIKQDRVEIKQGLKSGDRLIIAGHQFVAPGQKVNALSENE